MLVYILKSVLCLFVLLTFYKFFLENEKAHSFKRFYLLGSLLLSLLLPLITFTYTTKTQVNNDVHFTSLEKPISDQIVSLSNFEVFVQDYLPYILLGIYLTGILFLSFRFVRNLRKMDDQIRKNKKLSEEPYIYVLLKSKLNPHTFLNYIFLNRNDYEKQKIAREVLLHEKAHVDQKHTLDILFIEFLQIIFWINPLFIWLKKSAKLNHEFLADEKVLQEVKNAPLYSRILYNYAGGSHQAALSSSINYSLTKKRILMISKSFSIRKFLIRLGLFVPVLGCCLFFFNNKIIAKPIMVSIEHTNENSVLDGKIIKNETGEIFSESIIPLKNIQEKGVLHIRVEGEKIWLNDKLVKLEDFSTELNAVTKDWDDEAMENPYFYIDFSNSNTNFIEKLNKEYRKSKLSKISGTEFMAPRPPAPAGTPPPPPPPPVVERSEQVPPPPSAKKSEVPPAPAPESINTSERRMAIQEGNHRRETLRTERQILLEEKERLRDEKKEMKKDKDLSRRERERMERDIAREKQRMEKRVKQIDKEQTEIERLRGEIPPPPPPPNPIDEIDRIESVGGTFYYNGNKITASKAKRIVSEKEDFNIRITGKNTNAEKVEITDN